jgi:hypothetical protein
MKSIYSFNPFKDGRLYIFIVLNCFLVYSYKTTLAPSVFYILLVVFFEIFTFYNLGRGLNYFLIDSEKIEIRNYWLFWRKSIYYFHTISWIEFNNIYGEGTTLTFVEKNNHRNGVIASGLSREVLKRMEKHLKELGIKVRINISL